MARSGGGKDGDERDRVCRWNRTRGGAALFHLRNDAGDDVIVIGTIEGHGGGGSMAQDMIFHPFFSCNWPARSRPQLGLCDSGGKGIPNQLVLVCLLFLFQGHDVPSTIQRIEGAQAENLNHVSMEGRDQDGYCHARLCQETQ